MNSAQRGRRIYTTKRTLLILLLGSKCSYCQERRPWMLQFHHTKRPCWSPHKTSRHRRIKLYMQDWANGILVLACGKCNKQRGQPDEDSVPF